MRLFFRQKVSESYLFYIDFDTLQRNIRILSAYFDAGAVIDIAAEIAL